MISNFRQNLTPLSWPVSGKTRTNLDLLSHSPFPALIDALPSPCLLKLAKNFALAKCHFRMV